MGLQGAKAHVTKLKNQIRRMEQKIEGMRREVREFEEIIQKVEREGPRERKPMLVRK